VYLLLYKGCRVEWGNWRKQFFPELVRCWSWISHSRRWNQNNICRLSSVWRSLSELTWNVGCTEVLTLASLVCHLFLSYVCNKVRRVGILWITFGSGKDGKA